MPQEVLHLVCFKAYSGDGRGSYGDPIWYDEYDELIADVRRALDNGREILIEREFLTEKEYRELRDAIGVDTFHRFRGDMS